MPELIYGMEIHEGHLKRDGSGRNLLKIKILKNREEKNMLKMVRKLLGQDEPDVGFFFVRNFNRLVMYGLKHFLPSTDIFVIFSF